jgi:hypothetical protein
VAKSSGKTACFEVLAHLMARRVVAFRILEFGKQNKRKAGREEKQKELFLISCVPYFLSWALLHPVKELLKFEF